VNEFVNIIYILLKSNDDATDPGNLYYAEVQLIQNLLHNIECKLNKMCVKINIIYNV